VQLLPGISCRRLTTDANQIERLRSVGEPQALFDAARRDARRRLSARPVAFASEMRTSP
jgi:hypothetical protein